MPERRDLLRYNLVTQPVNLSLSHSPIPSTPSPPHKRFKPNHPPTYSASELGKWSLRLARRLARLGWARFHKTLSQSSINRHIASLPHPAARLLHTIATHGVPAPSSSPPWTPEQQDAAVNRGPHPSAAKVYKQFLLEDMAEMVAMGYWTIVPYSAIRGHPHLKISPSGVVPQRDRRPRPIMDYTFSTVNTHSVDIAPAHSMQFGTALQRILQRLAYCNPTWGPPLLAKLDLADGYYRVPLAAEASLELAVILPSEDFHEPLLGIPLSLPMGWALSPPWFCAFTETCADLYNNIPRPTILNHPYHTIVHLNGDHQPTPSFAPDAIFPYSPTLAQQPLSYTDVYLDDFMLLSQAPTHIPAINSLLHHLHSIFQDPLHSNRRQVVSQSKVLKGDATFHTTKRLLGWDINTAHLTIQLPPHRQERMHALLATFLQKKFTTRKQWQQLLGELRSMSLALHSSSLLFSLLQHLLKGNRRRMRLPRLAKLALSDWQHMLTTLTAHPVPITSLVPHAPHYFGATDASAEGMGGWWIPTTLASDAHPTVWRQPFPDTVRQALTTATHQGTVNNSELELAAAVLGHELLLKSTPWHPYRSVLQGIDNSAAQAWITRGTTSASFIPAHFLRLLACASRNHNSRLSALFIPGKTNTLSDLLSRSFHLTDTELLHNIQQMAPLQQPWRLVTPTEAEVSTVNSILLKLKQSEEYHFPGQPVMTPHGLPGRSSVSPYHKTRGSATLTTPCQSFRYLPTDTASVRWLPPALLSRLERWRQPFVPWARRSPHWVSVTQDSKHLDDWTSVYTDNSKLIQKRTHPRQELNPSPYRF